jgi:endoglucanase
MELNDRCASAIRRLLVVTAALGAAISALALSVTTVVHADQGSDQTRRVPPPAQLTLDLKRSICIDRQFRRIPPEPIMRFTRQDIQLIKAMGFDSVKLLVNPEPLMDPRARLDQTKQWYLKEMVETVVGEDMPVIVCIHPEWEHKERILSDENEFTRFLGFLDDTARFLAAAWGPRQLVLQLMTEPGGNALDWNELQPRMWQVARQAMPLHTLILAGDQVGKIEGLITTEPVQDQNVAYSFTFYDPFILTLQGAEWLTPGLWSHLGDIPYPGTPEAVAERLPSILARIPDEQPDWRRAAEGMLIEYGDARWNREGIAARVRLLADWNRRHGGGLRIWCGEFGCYQRTIPPADRYRYLRDVRDAFEAHGIGWAYWSYNETFTVMSSDRQPFGPAERQAPDRTLLETLLGQ